MTTSDDHTWTIRSRHRTSTGIVSYQSCHCGLWRITHGTESVLAHHAGAGQPGMTTRRWAPESSPYPAVRRPRK
ncbi:hypothetical protein [Micromonospora polyrhachis]|uniref:Uncharacterized protein n=1 Tax=Micromonospora polyrhachis TaxID=1282883 RepID=A0A7W7SNJ7_9ACTN|nr:hypothetical protein [Micromonospora polyrhachis]MBB4958064.1 hypothetical protein [Micromonospora polyrhachis]